MFLLILFFIFSLEATQDPKIEIIETRMRNSLTGNYYISYSKGSNVILFDTDKWELYGYTKVTNDTGSKITIQMRLDKRQKSFSEYLLEYFELQREYERQLRQKKS